MLWKYLRANQFKALKFRRQHPVGDYIVDFICFDKRIVIEVDGGQHAVNVQDDHARDSWLKGQGFEVLRFWNNEVLQNIEGVIETIRKALNV